MLRYPALLLAVLSFAPTHAVAQDKATIQSLNEKFAASFNAGDFSAVAGHYTEDAFLLPPGAEMMQGRSAIQAYWTGAGAQVGDLKLTAIDVKPLGSDAAREVGTFALKTKGPQPQDLSGKYVVIWQKVGTDWKLATDIWNSDK